MMENEKIYPFNNTIDTGLRMLALLDAAFPLSIGLDHLVYFDYLTLHSGDVDSKIESLHPPVPNRSGEIFIRRALIQGGLELFISKGLIEKNYNADGISYIASETATPFIDSLSELYTLRLIERASWVIESFKHLSLSNLRSLMAANISKWQNEFNLEIVR